MLIERFLGYVDRNTDYTISDSEGIRSPVITIGRDCDVYAVLTRLSESPRITFKACSRAYQVFGNAPNIHPPPNGYDDYWYVVDITPELSFDFLCYALELSQICTNGYWLTERDMINKTKELAAGLDPSSNVFSGTYSTRRIEPKADEIDKILASRILEMRKMLYSNEIRRLSPGAAYHKIAHMMGDLTDNCKKSFVRSVITYESKLEDLRAYFTWRTNYRKNVVNEVPDPFAYLYAVELANGVGWTAPKDGQELFIKACRELKTNCYADRYRRWISDFSAYHDIPLDNIFKLTEGQRLMKQLFDMRSMNTDELVSFLKSAIGFDLENKRAFSHDREAYANVIVRFFDNVLAMSNSKTGKSLKPLFGWNVDPWYELFCDLPVKLDEEHGSYTYTFDGICRYKFDGNYCTVSVCTMSRSVMRDLSEALYTLESLMRKEFKLPKTKERLSPESEYYVCLTKAIHDWKQDRNKRVVVIDTNILDAVRHDALEISQKIRTSEEIDDEPEIQDNTVSVDSGSEAVANEPGSSECGPGLDANEVGFVKLLLEGGDWNLFLKERHMMLSLIVDSVNEKFFESLSDTLIEIRDGVPIIIDDYIDYVKGIVCQ